MAVKKWTMTSYCASGYDRKEDAFGANLLGVSVAKFKTYPESKELDRIWVKLLNRAEADKASAKPKTATKRSK